MNLNELQQLIEDVERDPIPFNEYTIEDKDPMVVLGKLNEVESRLREIADFAGGADAKADNAVTVANNANATSNTALNTANTALESANTALNTANTALEHVVDAVDASARAEQKADNAVTIANNANATAINADANATTALMDASDAVSTANEANTKADNANTKADNAVEVANEANTKADNANTKADNAVEVANEANTKADNANTKADNAVEVANEANTKADNANSTASNAVATANSALEQVTQGLGTRVYNYNNQLLTEAKFLGVNNINVDMDDTNPNQFNISLDESVVTAIEDLNTELESEKATRASNDQTITASVNDIDATLTQEISNRASGDQTLQNNLATIANEVMQTASNLNNEITNRINADSQIASNIYPVGAIYLTIDSISPASFIGGTWEQIAQGRALFGAGTLNGIEYVAGATKDAGLPNITGKFVIGNAFIGTLYDGAFYGSEPSTNYYRDSSAYTTQGTPINNFDASKSNSIYGNSATVQPNAYVVNVWKRIA